MGFPARSLSSGITSCTDFSDLATSKSAFDLTLSVGVGVYVTEDLGNVLFGDLFSGETEIYVSRPSLRFLLLPSALGTYANPCY